MNLVLARAGYPPVAIRPEDRPAYIAALEIDQRGGGHAAFDRLLFERLDQTLNLYLDAAHQARDASAHAGKIIPMRS
jgi:Fic family protein